LRDLKQCSKMRAAINGVSLLHRDNMNAFMAQAYNIGGKLCEVTQKTLLNVPYELRGCKLSIVSF